MGRDWGLDIGTDDTLVTLPNVQFWDSRDVRSNGEKTDPNERFTVKHGSLVEIEGGSFMSPAEIQRQHRFLRRFAAHEPAIRAFVRRLVPSRADADDVMQESAVVLWEKFEQFNEGADFRAWAFGIARFEVLAWLRDKGRDRLVLADDVIELIAQESAHDEPQLELQREALEHCMQKLPSDQRNLLLTAYQPESSIQEAASASGRTVGGFYQWLHRMRKALQDCVKRQVEKEEASI